MLPNVAEEITIQKQVIS